MTYRVGDVVQLRYGSRTRMRVENVNISSGNEWVVCVWGDANECHNYFAAEMLQRAEPEKPPQRAAPEPPRRAEPSGASGQAGPLAALWDMLAFWRHRGS